MNHVRKAACALAARYGTTDPFELCGRMGIRFSAEPLPPAIRGVFYHSIGFDFIHVNRLLCPCEQRLVCAHELGHAVLHPGVNSIFLSHNSYLSESKLETQADLFAACLLVDDDVFSGEGDESLTLETLSARLRIPSRYLELKYEILSQEGQGNPPLFR